MGYSIIYDRRSVKLNDGTYILMMQTGSNNCYEVRNGREIPEKYWVGLHLVNEKAGEINCSLQQMKNRIAEFATCYGSVAKSRGNFFQSEEELRKYLEGGLKYPFTFDEYKTAGNTFQVSCWDKEQRKIVGQVVYTEEQMKATINKFVSNPDYECVNIKFLGRDLSKPKAKLMHEYIISAIDELGIKTYYKKKTSKYLRFTVQSIKAHKFAKESQAQKFIDSFPELKQSMQLSIEEINVSENQIQTENQNSLEAE